ASSRPRATQYRRQHLAPVCGANPNTAIRKNQALQTYACKGHRPPVIEFFSYSFLKTLSSVSATQGGRRIQRFIVCQAYSIVGQIQLPVLDDRKLFNFLVVIPSFHHTSPGRVA